MASEMIAEAITDYFGERCPDFDAECFCCKAWAEYDRLTCPTSARCDELVTTSRINGTLLVTRQNAEEVIAAKDARIAVLEAERDHWKEYSSGQGKLIESGVFVKNDEYIVLTSLEADNKRLREALERITDWPNGGKNYGQENIKGFARAVLRGGETMKDLIDRLSKLDGPDREVDAEICILFQYGGENSEGTTNVRTDHVCYGDLLFEIGNEGCCNPIPKLTSSVDAAIALAERVLPGHRWSAGFSRHVPHSAQIWVPSGSGYYEGESDANRAIALCIAILRANEASHD